jgi:hypothetical protein
MPLALMVTVGGPDGAGGGVFTGGVGDDGVDDDAPLEQAAIVSVTTRNREARSTASPSAGGAAGLGCPNTNS